MGEPKIKRGLNFYWYYWTIIVFLGFILINYYTRYFKIEVLDVGLMISVVSFLFGFLISITFSMLLNRTAILKDSLTAETGRLVSLFSLSKHLGQKFHGRVRERIDSYTIKTLRGYKQYEISREDFYGFYDDLQFMEIKTEQQNNFAGSFLYVLGEMSTIREKLEYLTNRKVEFSIKVADYTLGILLIALLFMNRNDPFTNIIFILVSTIIVFIFLIIEDFDNLRIADYSANISNSEQIFDLIRRERYYPQRLLSRVKLEEGRKYRIGIYNSKLKEEEIFEIIYNSVFKIKINKILEKFKGRDK